MNLYNAAIYTNSLHIGSSIYNRLNDNEKWQIQQRPNILESFHYVKGQRYVENMRRDKVQVFLDSGAFSAYTLGKKVDLPGYCRYIQQNEDIIRKDGGALLASVLDGIGDPLKTYQNQKAMERLGVRPLPCFHYGEDTRYLDYYIANYEYITIGGMVPISTPQLKMWLDDIWERNLCDGSGRPKVKVHGFGLTTPMLMRRYPWHSVDSSSWVQMARTGGILLLPEAKNINVSAQSPNRKVEGQHISTYTPAIREALIKRFEAHGVDMVRIGEVYPPRYAYNIYAFTQLGKLITAEKGENPTFHGDQITLF